jgi:PKD repeat protein
MPLKRAVLICFVLSAFAMGCEGDDPVEPTKPTADFSATPRSGTAPLTVNFTDRSTGSPTGWEWDFGDGFGSTSRNPSHTFTSAGSYSVFLRATSASGEDTETKNGYITVGVLTQVTVSASKDNTLYEDVAGAFSNGAGNFFFAGKTAGTTPPAENRRAVFSFNVAGSGVPPGSTIDSVFLVLTMDKTVAGGSAVTLHRLSADWGEGTSAPLDPNEGRGDASESGDATWIHTFYNTTFWTTPGGDFTGGASASTGVSGVGTYTWGSTSAMVVDVQGWLDTPATNFGWILIGDESQPTTAKRFASRTNPTAANRPKLVIHFTAP